MNIRAFIALIAASVLFVFLASACGGEETPQHPSWKDSNEYCYWFKVDPRGEFNSMIGWSDEEPILETSAAGFVLRAKNVRVDDATDRFKSSVAWATDGDGYVNIEDRCQ